jgi:hypothetical protein
VSQTVHRHQVASDTTGTMAHTAFRVFVTILHLFTFHSNFPLSSCHLYRTFDIRICPPARRQNSALNNHTFTDLAQRLTSLRHGTHHRVDMRPRLSCCNTTNCFVRFRLRDSHHPEARTAARSRSNWRMPQTDWTGRPEPHRSEVNG